MDFVGTNDTSYMAIQLSSFYNSDIGIKIKESDLNMLLPKTKNNEIKEKIIRNNIIIKSLKSHKEVIFYRASDKKIYTQEISESIKYNKGYMIIYSPSLIKIFKKYIYTRKLYNTEPQKIEPLIENFTFLDSLNNKNFSNKLWINDHYLFLKNKKKPTLLKNVYDIKILLEPINFLNSFKLSYDEEIFEKMYKISSKHKYYDNLGLNLGSLINNTYIQEKESNNLIIIYDDNSEIDINLSKIFNSIAAIELIKIQLKRIKLFNNGIFYLSYLLDSRTRIYCWPWPLNFQLNHIVRCFIIFTKKYKINEIYNNFFNHPIILKYIIKCKYFLYETVENKNILNNFIKEKKIKICINNIEIDYENIAKYETLIILLQKLSPKNIKKIDEKIKFAIENFDYFIKTNLTTDYKPWLEKLKIKEKKLVYLITLQKNLIDINKNIFKGTFWGDASSNALQLITFRLGTNNEKLWMLTNIINNTTEYPNIYNYITEKINTYDHTEILKKIENKLTNQELIELQDDDDNKARAMPGSYGMSAFKNTKIMEETFKNDERREIWNKLNNENKLIIANYFWKLTFKILENVGFFLKEYKKKCKTKEKINIWENDYGSPIAPLAFKKSKRSEIMIKIEKINWLIKTDENQENIKKLIKKKEKLNKKLNNDEKTFYKRTRIKVNDSTITIRIPNNPLILDDKKNKTALTPNTIHSYDSSISFMLTTICKELGIEILLIHDSVGCELLLGPIIKILFKIVNIHYIEQAKVKAPYPFKKIIYNKEINYNVLYKNILESKDFFR